jgi:hypothetical protein
MAYERTWPNVEYERVTLSYHENSLSGVVFIKQKYRIFPASLTAVLTGLLTGF